jgi:4a-hydroxytetrahydrobiopterin dehydratase
MTLPPSDRDDFLSSHPEWSLDGETINRTFVFADFIAAMGFVTKVAIASERADHHPDIDIRWNKVTIALTTHSAGGLTPKDTALAAEIDGY